VSGILVTGSGGMLGLDVLRAAEARGVEAHGLTRAQLDIADPVQVAEAIASHQPDVIINCAAWTDVDGAEEHESEALVVNGEGPKVLAEAGPRVVQVSTDYVFDGEKEGAWIESDPVGPKSAYGRTKLVGDQSVLAANPANAVVRTAWLFGVGGNNFVETMIKLANERGAVSVVDDQRGCPTNTAHLAEALLDIALDESAGGIHHCAGAGETSWFGFAKEIFERTGTPCDLTPTTSDAFVRPAPRPANSVLEVTRDDTPRLPEWQQGLDDYISLRMTTGGQE
jgi:dTDP-4-dehydrorhamnose reductase